MSELDLLVEQGRASVELSTLTGGWVSVTRTHPSGREIPVRNMTLVPLSGGSFIGWDYEIPIGVPVLYQATSYLDADGALQADTSNAVLITWDTTNEWLKDPLEPIRNLPIRVVDMSSYHYSTPASVHTVLGRPDPVTIGEVRRAADGVVTLLTVTKEERDRLHYITASGNVLLLQSTQDSGVGNMYIALLDIQENRISTRDVPDREWILGYQEVGPPVGDAGAFVTYQDLVNTYATYQDIVDSWNTYIELTEGLGQTTPPPILTWRGA